MVRRTAAVAAVLVLALAGCSGESATPGGAAQPTGTTGAAPTGGGESDAVAWAEEVCSAVAPEVEKLGQGPDINPNDPQAAKDSLVSYLDTLVSALDRMIAGMRDAGAPPVADGQVAVDRAVATLDEAKGAVESAKGELESVDATDPQAFQAAFTKVGQDLQALADLDNPMEGLRGNQELNDAFQQAPSCQALSGSSGTGTATATPTS